MNARFFVSADLHDLLPVVHDSAGRVVVAPFSEVMSSTPWVRLEPLVDVLRKLPDDDTGSPYTWWDHRQDPPHGRGPWEMALDVPFDWEWARPRVVLPDDISYEPPPAGGGYGLLRAAGSCCIFSRWKPQSRTWRDAGWVQGQPYDGPRPAPRRHWWRQ